MQVYIQNPENKMFIDENSDWTWTAGEARDFGSIGDALELCYAHSLSHYQLLLKFETPSFEITLTRRDAERVGGILPVEENEFCAN